jgi:ankyrin repeat protein
MKSRKSISPEEMAAASQAAFSGDVDGLTAFVHAYKDHPQFLQRNAYTGFKPENDDAENARLLIIYAHHFNTWAAYEQFKQKLNDQGSGLFKFEQAADAVVTGDIARLKKLLHQNPDLITMRSVRNHHSTLLNYVGANGVENYRQKTPANAVEVAELLLNAGAEVDARGAMYRGTSTLGLVATSVHPVVAGLQEPLMDVLISHGADPNRAVAPDYTEGMLILACIHNGRYEPIHYLARRGAKVDLEGACALGDLATVKQLYGSMPQKREIGLVWACVYGHTEVVDYLLEQGVPVNIETDGTTPLHSAAFGGQLQLLQKLIDLGAPMEAVNKYGGTVLGTTLWCLYNNRKPAHAEIMEMLIARDAIVDKDWWKFINEIRKQHG